MKFKLDECLDIRLTEHFKDAGYDIETVYDENISGISDEALYSICIKENRIFVTQDMDFSNPFRLSPIPTKGIVVLRNPTQTFPDAKHLVEIFIKQLNQESPEGQLWIITRYGVRVWPKE